MTHSKTIPTSEAGTENVNREILTKRQNQCLQLIATGLTVAAVAHDLECSERMVRTHLRKARQRLGAHSTAEAVYIALKHNILE